MGGRGFKRKRYPSDGRIPKALALGDCKGHAGVLVMCDEKKEQRAMHEVADLINDFASSHAEFAMQEDAAEAPGQADATATESASAAAYHSVADELAAELAAIQGRSTSASAPSAPIRLHDKFSSKRARFMELGFRGLGLVWMADKEAAQGHACALAAVHDAMENSLRDKVTPTRSVSRMIPLARIVSANGDEIGQAVRELIEAVSLAEGVNKTYRLDVRSRNNTTFDKSAAMSCVYSVMVGCGFKRQEDGGAWVVVVEVFKTYAGVSVLRGQDWDRYHRYNIRLCGERDEDRQARLAKASAPAVGTGGSAARGGTGVGTGGQQEADSTGEDDEEGSDSDAAGGAEIAHIAVPTIAGAQAWVPTTSAAASKRAKGEERVAQAPAQPAWHALIQLEHNGGGRCVIQMGQGMPASLSASTSTGADGADADEPHPYLAFTVQAGRRVVVNHTYTPPAFRGKGLAALLCDATFCWARQQGYSVLPECSYVRDRYVPDLLAGRREGSARECMWGPAAGSEGLIEAGTWKSAGDGSVVATA